MPMHEGLVDPRARPVQLCDEDGHGQNFRIDQNPVAIENDKPDIHPQTLGERSSPSKAA